MSTETPPVTEPGPADYVPTYRIVEGADYLYQPHWPPGRRGCRYRVACFATHWPVGHPCVVYVGQEGPDEGQVCCCSPVNFAGRFAPVPPPPAETGDVLRIDLWGPSGRADAPIADPPLAATRWAIDMHHALPDLGDDQAEDRMASGG